MYMLDTSIWIEIMHGRLQIAFDLMQEASPDMFKVPAIVAAELYYGAEHSANSAENYRITNRLLQPYEIVPFDAHCARAYARINNELRSKGTPIGPNDTLIAATAVAHEAVLVTNNEREFMRVKGLVVENWRDISDIWQETADIGRN